MDHVRNIHGYKYSENNPVEIQTEKKDVNHHKNRGCNMRAEDVEQDRHQIDTVYGVSNGIYEVRHGGHAGGSGAVDSQ